MIGPRTLAAVLGLTATAAAGATACRSPEPAPEGTSASALVGSIYPAGSREDAIFAAQLEQAGARHHGLLVLGDSIVWQWQTVGASSWTRMLPCRPLGLGVPGDTIERVAQRVRAGTLGPSQPRWIVLMVGTNDGSLGAEAVARDLRSLGQAIATARPSAEVLVLSILPRNAPGSALREKNQRTNALLASDVWAPTSRFVDVAGLFVDPSAALNDGISADQLHLTAAGYERLVGELARHIACIEPDHR